jgi:hypothetical protein
MQHEINPAEATKVFDGLKDFFVARNIDPQTASMLMLELVGVDLAYRSQSADMFIDNWNALVDCFTRHAIDFFQAKNDQAPDRSIH